MASSTQLRGVLGRWSLPSLRAFRRSGRLGWLYQPSCVGCWVGGADPAYAADPAYGLAHRLFDPRDVFARARVDLDHLVLADEQRHADHGAGFQRRRLAAAAGGVAAHARGSEEHTSELQS